MSLNKPDHSMISDLPASVTTDTSNASNISSGVLKVAQGGTGQGTYAEKDILVGESDGSLGKYKLTSGDNINIYFSNNSLIIEASGGVSGQNGATGATGPQGPKGATGPAGSNGATGATGVAGSDGATGATGVAGYNGAKGATGSAGSNGAVGATGPAGAGYRFAGVWILSTGYSIRDIVTSGGSMYAAIQNVPAWTTDISDTNYWEILLKAGEDGTNGSGTGPTGATGVIGATGSTGVAGNTGATGSVGATGSAGSNGATGATGSAGSNGATGATGPRGATGAATQGATGPIGATGPAGSIGINGVSGATGANGPGGLTGATGPTGMTGATGQGATGTAGVAGPISIACTRFTGNGNMSGFFPITGYVGTDPLRYFVTINGILQDPDSVQPAYTVSASNGGTVEFNFTPADNAKIAVRIFGQSGSSEVPKTPVSGGNWYDDASSAHLTVNLSGDVTQSDEGGGVKAAAFAGAGMLSIPNLIASLNLATIEFWLNPTYTGQVTILGATNVINAGITPADNHAFFVNNGLIDDGSRIPLDYGVWQHIAIVVDNGNKFLYKNGLLVQTSTQTFNTNGQPITLQIGNLFGFYSGKITGIRISDGVARYSNTNYFNVPTTIATSDNYTNLLLNFGATSYPVVPSFGPTTLSTPGTYTVNVPTGVSSYIISAQAGDGVAGTGTNGQDGQAGVAGYIDEYDVFHAPTTGDNGADGTSTPGQAGKSISIAELGIYIAGGAAGGDGTPGYGGGGSGGGGGGFGLNGIYYGADGRRGNGGQFVGGEGGAGGTSNSSYGYQGNVGYYGGGNGGAGGGGNNNGQGGDGGKFGGGGGGGGGGFAGVGVGVSGEPGKGGYGQSGSPGGSGESYNNTVSLNSATQFTVVISDGGGNASITLSPQI